uniref:DUF222 domain-containing protein n=1 Tax=Georgenia sp. M64 TaxID=3120520 RepID=UPI004049AAD6
MSDPHPRVAPMFDDAAAPPFRSSYTLHPATADLRMEVVFPLRDPKLFSNLESALWALLMPEGIAESDEAPAPGPEPRTTSDEVGADPAVVATTDPAVATGDVTADPSSDPLRHARELRGLSLALALELIDPDELGEAALVDAVELWSAVVSFAEARRGRAAASLERKIEEKYGAAGNLHRDSKGNRLPVAATELCMRLGMSRPAAGVIVRTGVLLEGQLCATGQALERGQIDQRKAEIIATALDGKAFPLTAAVEDEVLPRAGRRTHRQLQNDLTDALLRLDPHGAQQRHQAARARRCITHPRPLPDGMVGNLPRGAGGGRSRPRSRARLRRALAARRRGQAHHRPAAGRPADRCRDRCPADRLVRPDPGPACPPATGARTICRSVGDGGRRRCEGGRPRRSRRRCVPASGRAARRGGRRACADQRDRPAEHPPRG